MTTTTQFTRRAPKAASINGRIFGGRDLNKIGDILMGVFAGVTDPMGENGTIGYIFLDENSNYEKVMIFGCASINEQMPYYQIGDRLQITLSNRFIATKGRAVGKMIVQYDIQVDESFEPTQEILDACDAAMAKPQGPSQVTKSPAVATSKSVTIPAPAVARRPITATENKKPVDANNPFPV